MRRFVLAGLLFPAIAWSKDPCSGVNVKQDAFDPGSYVIGRTGATVAIDKTGAHAEFNMGEAGGTSNVALEPGFPLLLLLEDGTTVTLTSDNTAPAQTKVYADAYSASASTHWMVDFPLDSAMLELLSQKKISTMRYTISRQTTWNVPGGTQKLYQKTFMCAASRASSATDGG